MIQDILPHKYTVSYKVTIRNRDTMEQITLKIDEVIPYIESNLEF